MRLGLRLSASHVGTILPADLVLVIQAWAGWRTSNRPGCWSYRGLVLLAMSFALMGTVAASGLYCPWWPGSPSGASAWDSSFRR
jgi:hypothetical protein